VTNPIKPAKLAAAFCHSLIHYHQILPALAIEEPPCFAQSARNQAPIQPEAEDCGAIVKFPARLYDLRIKDSDSAEGKAPNVEARHGQINPAAGIRRVA